MPHHEDSTTIHFSSRRGVRDCRDHVGVNEDREADADLVEVEIGGGGVAANAALARKYEDVLKYWVVI